MSLGKGTSRYRGVFFSTPNKNWVVYLEHHKSYPCFRDERDAGIYAEYIYRKIDGLSPNFPELSDDDLYAEYKRVLLKRETEFDFDRSACKQGWYRNLLMKVKAQKEGIIR